MLNSDFMGKTIFVSPERVQKETMKSLFLYVVFMYVYVCSMYVRPVKLLFHGCHLKSTTSIQTKLGNNDQWVRD